MLLLLRKVASKLKRLIFVSTSSCAGHQQVHNPNMLETSSYLINRLIIFMALQVILIFCASKKLMAVLKLFIDKTKNKCSSILAEMSAVMERVFSYVDISANSVGPVDH